MPNDKTWQPHQRRVFEERLALDELREKLRSFFNNAVFRTLPEDEQERMARQYDAMTLYSSILGERIAAF